MAFRPSTSGRPVGSSGPHSSLLPNVGTDTGPGSARMPPPPTPTGLLTTPLTSSVSAATAITAAAAESSSVPRVVIAGHSHTTGAALHGLSRDRSAAMLNTRPATTNAALPPLMKMANPVTSNSTADMPLIHEPIRFPIPSYLQHSAFADSFIVGSSLASSLKQSQRRESTSTISPPRLTTASVVAPVPYFAQPASNEKGKQRDISLLSEEQRDNSGRPFNAYRVSLPSRLDAAHCCKRLLISQDGYGLQYMPERDEHGREKINTRDPDADAAAIRADFPIPPQTGVYYFEVEVVNRGQKGYIGIGFASRLVSLGRLPGWEPESYGYHGDDGKAFACSGTGQAYGPKFGSGDVIGCGIDFVSRKAFFVKNGNWLGYVFDLSGPLSFGSNTIGTRRKERAKVTTESGPLEFYPTVGLQTTGEQVRFNFGQSAFRFDIDSFVKRRKQEMTDGVLSHPIPRRLLSMLSSSNTAMPTGTITTDPTAAAETTASAPADAITDVDADTAFTSNHFMLQAAMQHLVSSYLTHRGYCDTARAFRAAREAEKRSWADLLQAAPSRVAAPNGGGAGSAVTKPSGSATKVKKKSSKGASLSGSAKMLKSALRTTLSREDMREDGTVHNLAETSGIPGSEAGSETHGDDSMVVDEGTDAFITSAEASGSGRSTGISTPTFRTVPAVSHDNVPTDIDSSRDERERDEDDLLDTMRRQTVSLAIKQGDIDTALNELENNYPAVLDGSFRKRSRSSPTTEPADQATSPKSRETHQNLMFKMRCRKFVELILAAAKSAGEALSDTDMDDNGFDDTEGHTEDRGESINDDGDDDEAIVASSLIPSRRQIKESNGHKKHGEDPRRGSVTVDMETVLAYGSELSAAYSGSSDSKPILQCIFSLIAYPDPSSLPGEMGFLCSQAARDNLAEEVNSAMLMSRGRSGKPLLDMVYRQTFAVQQALGQLAYDGRAAMVGSILDD